MDPKYSNPRFTGWRVVKSCRKHLVQKQRKNLGEWNNSGSWYIFVSHGKQSKILGELKTVNFLVKWIHKTSIPDLQTGESRKAVVQKQHKIFGELNTVKVSVILWRPGTRKRETLIYELSKFCAFLALESRVLFENAIVRATILKKVKIFIFASIPIDSKLQVGFLPRKS